MPSARTGYQPRTTPAERRAFFDVQRQLAIAGDEGSLPPGGATGQVLAKQSAVDGDAIWVPPAPKGDTGPKGDKGDTGATGATGQGVPAGGTAGQRLAKIDATNYNTQWVNPPLQARLRSNGSAAAYAPGDSTVPVTGIATNIGGFTINGSSQIVVPVAGTYAVSFTFGGASFVATTSAVALTAGFTIGFPCFAGTTWRCGGTYIATLAAAALIFFTFRNGHSASVTEALSTEVLLLADW